MGYNFPNSPVLDELWTPPGGPSWRWNGYGWMEIEVPTTGIEEAPADGIDYVRKNAAWNVLPVDIASWASITGKPSTFPPDPHTHAYSSLTGIPATFPPTLPIAQADVTGLVAGQSAQDTAIGTKLNSSAYTAADVLAKLVTVDGSGSNLDADLLDGNDGAFYATASSVTGKEPAIAAGTAAQYWQGTKTWQTLNSSAVGLGNVDNTSDASKPVSTAQATADALKVALAGDTMTGPLGLPNGAVGTPSLYFPNGGATTGVDTGIYAASNLVGFTFDGSLKLWANVNGGSVSGTFGVTSLLAGSTAVAIPAGGSNTSGGIKFSSTANFGIFFGSGAPSLSAAKGSLYLRSDGTSNVTRMYVNTDGAATWTAVNTVA